MASYVNEIYRKLMHISSAAIPLAYVWLLDREQLVWILGVASIVVFVGEVLRMKIPFFMLLYRKLFGMFVRDEENDSFTALTFSLIGALLTVFLFEKMVAVYALLVMALADSVAALVGLRWGRTPLFDKTVQGTVTFLVIALILAFATPGIPRIPAAVAAAVATVVELFPSPLNDNLLVPLTTAVTLTLTHLVI
ncbi:MAG: diacylglycerol/polyprenol kinase family protein [Fidelibacterota bacterium]